jgi:hypothetical protein
MTTAGPGAVDRLTVGGPAGGRLPVGRLVASPDPEAGPRGLRHLTMARGTRRVDQWQR